MIDNNGSLFKKTHSAITTFLSIESSKEVKVRIVFIRYFGVQWIALLPLGNY